PDDAVPPGSPGWAERTRRTGVDRSRRTARADLPARDRPYGRPPVPGPLGATGAEAGDGRHPRPRSRERAAQGAAATLTTVGTPAPGRPLRIASLGNAQWSVPPLEAVRRSRHPIALVLTRDARPAGRGHRLRRTPVAEATERHGLPLLETPTAARGEGFDR